MEYRYGSMEPAESEWQRRAARLLRFLAYQNRGLPGLTWAISPDGLLSGWTGRDIPPRDGLEVFAAWRDSLDLGHFLELPGRFGRPGYFHAGGYIERVFISFDARVLPPGPVGPGANVNPGAPGRGCQPTQHYLPAIVALGNLLEVHRRVPAITWLISSPGEITGHVSLTASRHGGTDLLAAWQDALRFPPARTPVRPAVSGSFTGARVTIAIGMPGRLAPGPAPYGGRYRPVPRDRTARSTTVLPQPRPDNGRPGPSQRP
jgi:hypothetical protein